MDDGGKGAEMVDLEFARLTHAVHVDRDDSCPLCIADEIQASAERRYEALAATPLDELLDNGRLNGALARNAGRKLDLADAIREGSVRITSIERSGLAGLSIRYEGSRL